MTIVPKKAGTVFALGLLVSATSACLAQSPGNPQALDAQTPVMMHHNEGTQDECNAWQSGLD